MSPYPISEEQVRLYQEQGFIRLLGVLTPEELEAIRAAVDDTLRLKLDWRHDLSGHPQKDRIFVHKLNLWQVQPGVRAHVFNPKLAEIARRLAQASTIRLWHDHLLIKNPGDSAPTAWHQDLPHWPMQESGALSCWMALDDVDEDNGCLAFVPGSHRLGRLTPINLGDPQNLFALVPDAQRKAVELTPVYQPMPAGSCTFHNGLTFHSAGPNTSDRPRRAMIIIYMADDVHYTGRPHLVTYDLDLQPGDLLAGEAFPLLAETPDAPPSETSQEHWLPAMAPLSGPAPER